MAGRAPGRHQRVLTGKRAKPFFAVARQHEQRIVDADGQAHHDDHVGDQKIRLQQRASKHHDRQRHDDGRQRNEYRHERRHSAPEHHQQHQQGHRQADAQFSLEVLLRQRLELRADAGTPDQIPHEIGSGVVLRQRLLHFGNGALRIAHPYRHDRAVPIL